MQWQFWRKAAIARFDPNIWLFGPQMKAIPVIKVPTWRSMVVYQNMTFRQRIAWIREATEVHPATRQLRFEQGYRLRHVSIVARID
jgi:hypothetical protein